MKSRGGYIDGGADFNSASENDRKERYAGRATINPMARFSPIAPRRSRVDNVAEKNTPKWFFDKLTTSSRHETPEPATLLDMDTTLFSLVQAIVQFVAMFGACVTRRHLTNGIVGSHLIVIMQTRVSEFGGGPRTFTIGESAFLALLRELDRILYNYAELQRDDASTVLSVAVRNEWQRVIEHVLYHHPTEPYNPSSPRHQEIVRALTETSSAKIIALFPRDFRVACANATTRDDQFQAQ